VTEIESLFRWDADASQLSVMREKLRQHPRFSEAAQKLAANLLRDADEYPALNAMLRDAGHNVAALSAVYIHASGPVTLSRLRTFIGGFGLVSPGRARALLGYMRHLRCLEPASAEGRRVSYTLTSEFLASYTRHEASLLHALCIIEPAVDNLLRNLTAPGVMDSLVVEQGDAFVAGNRETASFTRWYRVFLHPLGGIQLLHTLVAGARTFPPTDKIAFSQAELSHRLNVSRIHVARLIGEAETEGFVVSEPGWLEFTAEGREALAWQYASRLCLHLACAARVLKKIPSLHAQAGA
jgi:hypothetical protein